MDKIYLPRPALQLVDILKKRLDPMMIFALGWERPFETGFSIFRKDVPPAGVYEYQFLVVTDAQNTGGDLMNLEMTRAVPDQFGYMLYRATPEKFKKWLQEGNLFAFLLVNNQAPILFQEKGIKLKIPDNPDISTITKETKDRAVMLLKKSENSHRSAKEYVKKGKFDTALFFMCYSVQFALCAILFQYTGLHFYERDKIKLLLQFAESFIGFPMKQFNPEALNSIHKKSDDLDKFSVAVVSEQDYYNALGTFLFILAEAKRFHLKPMTFDKSSQVPVKTESAT